LKLQEFMRGAPPKKVDDSPRGTFVRGRKNMKGKKTQKEGRIHRSILLLDALCERAFGRSRHEVSLAKETVGTSQKEKGTRGLKNPRGDLKHQSQTFPRGFHHDSWCS